MLTSLANRGLFALESIQAQVDNFGRSLESRISLIFDRIETGELPNQASVVRDPVVAEIKRLIWERMGMKVKLITDRGLAAVIPFYSNKNHIFVPDIWRGNFTLSDQERILSQYKERKGTVNVEKVKLGGIFSEYEVPVYMNFWWWKQLGSGPAEVTAALLHELGHAFYICYYADRTDRTNQVLASISRHALNKEKGDVEYVYRELEKINPGKAKEMADVLCNDSRTVAGTKWFNFIHETVRSQLSDDTYADTAFEQRADNFAARFGYGQHLATALEKISEFSPEKSAVMRTLVIATDIMTLGFLAWGTFFIFSGAGAVAIPAVGTRILYGFFMELALASILYSNREDVQDYTYDKLKFRYLRIRQDVVDQLKDPGMNRKTAEENLKTIYALDEIVRNTKEVRTLSMFLANLLSSKSREARKSITEQQLLEALASNDLFVKSAELRAQT